MGSSQLAPNGKRTATRPTKRTCTRTKTLSIANIKALGQHPTDHGQPLHVIALRKKAYLEALAAALGIASRASLNSGIPLRTHWHWLRVDEAYAEAVRDVKYIVKDFFEESLFDLVKARNAPATIFGSKCQLKDRGYVEIVHNVNQNFDDNVVVIYKIPDNGRDEIQEAEIVTQ